MKIESLYIYPVKSTIGISLEEIKVGKIGFENDRCFGIINSFNEIITARENPKLLKLKTEINGEKLKIFHKKQSKIVALNVPKKNIEVSLFKEITHGNVIIDNEINNWLTKILKTDSRIVKVDVKNFRETNNIKISFNDVYPIHLINLESVSVLNEKLDTPVEASRFRSNIIVSGFKAFEENNWKEIVIGECQFRVVSKTERCSLITIQPENGQRDKNQEPLRTLAKSFKSKGKVNFGIYLIPIKVGVIKKSDKVIIRTIINNDYD